MISVYCVILLFFSLTIFRVYRVGTTENYIQTAGTQGRFVMDVARVRGMIYDTNMNGLVNQNDRYLASVTPTVQAANGLLPLMEGEENRAALMSRLTDGTPFVLGLSMADVYADGVDVFRVPERYGDRLCPHIVGYLGGDGKTGVAGIEKAFDQFLVDTGSEIKVRYATDAAGRVMNGSGAGVERTGGEKSPGGVVLTIDSRIQAITRGALMNGCEKGAAVVLDVITGDILAMASLPDFDQNDIAASLESVDAPFINRAVSGYNIGSAFKVIVGAAALESGIPASYRHICEGYMELNGIRFNCNFNTVHGEIDMKKALEVSCNTYFISLAQKMNPAFLVSVARNLGLDKAVELAPGIITQQGNLPEALELTSLAAYANFSFGQGSSLATPLQMAQAIASIANSGLSVTPRLVKGFTLDGETLVEQTPIYSANQVISEKTARTMHDLMVSVVDEGSGRTAKPLQGGAGGKTSSAETGRLIDGEQVVHAWFTGFYPAESPKYSITVFVEGGESGEKVAAPIFKRIADGIRGLSTAA